METHLIRRRGCMRFMVVNASVSEQSRNRPGIGVYAVRGKDINVRILYVFFVRYIIDIPFVIYLAYANVSNDVRSVTSIMLNTIDQHRYLFILNFMRKTRNIFVVITTMSTCDNV